MKYTEIHLDQEFFSFSCKYLNSEIKNRRNKDLKGENKELLSIIDIEKWQILQDSLAAVTDMAIITVDYKGVPITRHSNFREFCRCMREDSVLNEGCQKCDSRGGLEATRLKRPYIYLCHANIIDAAIPIIVDNNYLGAIMIGQVKRSQESDAAQLETVCTLSQSNLKRMLESYTELMDALPEMPLDRVKIVVEMIFNICNYIVLQAIEKKLALEICTNTLMNPQISQNKLPKYPLKSLVSVKEELSSAITNARIQQDEDSLGDVKSSLLHPAMLYINEHKNESCPLAQMAALCHISPSYFSKLFIREVGENYSSYLRRSRIKWAKELLKTTNKTIDEIASDLGFSDAGHFIKIFKKHEGTTPARFRKYLS